MKTKQPKEESDKSIDEETVVEPKTRARKKASDLEEEKSKTSQDEPKVPQEPKKPAARPKTVVKKKPLGIRKTKNLRGKRVALAKKNVIKQAATRGRKPAVKKQDNPQDKEAVPLIPASEIKKEPADDTTPNSRSSSPKTTGRRSRLSSDMVMMKSVLGDSPNSIILGPRTSPYSMRSERSNSPSLFEGKNLRSGKPRKAKNILLNEVVIKEQKKRRRLLSDSKPETAESSEEFKKLKRGRSCSRDGSEISKCSDITESDISLNETLNDTESKELNKQIDKPKTELDVDIDTNVQISTIGKVPSLNVDSKTDTKPDSEPSSIGKDKRRLSLKRSTSLDSDNNNSNRIKINNLNSSDIELKLFETENDTLLEDRSSILNCMSKTFNSKEVSKNIRKARRGKKAAATPRPPANQNSNKNGTLASDLADDKPDTVDSLTKEINDLINNLDQNIDCDQDLPNDTNTTTADPMQSKSVRQFYGPSKPLGDNNSIVAPDTPVKDKEPSMQSVNECTPSKNDDSENIRLHYEEDSAEKSTDQNRQEVTYKRTTIASIDKLMDRLKEFEEFDKRRQRQESESKSTDTKSVMVTNDVVLIPKSGDIKPLKDLQPAKSPEKVIEKENVLSCFENNSAISIVKRDQVRRSIDVDLPNSVTLIKRNSVSARKESTSSNHSRESDAISIFEKSLGKDVTLTEIRKSVDRPSSTSQIDLHTFATLQPNNLTQTIGGLVLDSSQISITPRSVEAKLNSNDVQITKRNSRDSLSRKSSSSGIELDDKMATLEKIVSPQQQIKSPEISITPAPVAVKSPESQPIETEALAPPLEDVKSVPEDINNALQSATELESADTTKVGKTETMPEATKVETDADVKPKTDVEEKMATEPPKTGDKNLKTEEPSEVKVEDRSKTTKIKSARSSTEAQAGPSNMLHETPESQKRKENVLRTLGLLTHKAANEAKIKKMKEKEMIYGHNYNIMGKGKASKSDYTGTLKTVIKLNRGNGDKKKHRSSLKMTFQKSKNRGKPPVDIGETGAEDDAYYTIERREGAAGAASDGSHRKSHYCNRSNNHADAEAVPEPEPKETLNLVIPEKASSFSIHPGRLCMDQCFYCGGKFGLFDTPCHIAQMKSSERQKKVLDNEEKLTIDSCLCDACYRHVDRRANCPSYRKRPIGKPLDLPQPISPPNPARDKPASPEEESDEEVAPGRLAACHTSGCSAPADHSIRRKWLIKMRSSVSKLLKLEGDYPGLHTIPLCGEHYRTLAPLMACVLCQRRLTKHHNLHFIHHGYTDLNPLLKDAGIPVEFKERPVLCKVCRYYCTLLQRPGHNDNHAQAYRRKLLQIYNVEIPPELEQQTEDNTALEDCNNSANKQKKKTKVKTKPRKSTEPEKEATSESSERTTESSPEKEKLKEEVIETPPNTQPIDEDIESLISSNKIPVPGAKPPDSVQSDSETEMVTDEMPLLPLDKQTELRYLLQKQNNPAQFQHKANLTQKNKNILKVQNVGIQKIGQQHRINEKNAKRIQKIGQIVAHKDTPAKKETELEVFDPEKSKDVLIKNISLNDECTIETIPNKKPADINTLKNKWQLSESFSQVKKNLSELSKKLDKDPKKGSDSKYSNPVKRLETNPSISVRELFPGEEEMNLQCNIEFSSVKGVTPEGWEKCNSVIQYDVETKKLWNELQRPYGNQSSFLRHLILLEKYFRSGDLVLSHNASPHAANYSTSVQSRLKAYDNVAAEPQKPMSLIEFRKKPSMNGKSLLKTSQGEKKFMPPPEFAKPKAKEKAKSKQLPPELIAINTPNAQGRKAIQNVLHNIQQLVKGVSASDPTEVAAAPLPTPKEKEKKDSKVEAKEKKDSAAPKEKEKKEAKGTPKKQKGGWRPTLMPITQENLAKIAREPLKTAVDGHSLPSLVQVLSAGNRYHITFEDYNKMCLIRRERQQRLQEKEAKSKRLSTEETIVTEIQTSAMLGNGGTVVQNITTDKDDKKELNELQIGANAATILKNVGLKNITIAPIPPKTSTMTSQTLSLVTSPSILSTPIKMPLLTAVPITSDSIQNSTVVTSPMVMPKIPKSLTVIPQTMVTNQVVPVVTTAPSQTEPRP